ncbi:MAG: TlpA family protein disulfide reductase [Gemmatimonadetes bacterium]|nr:TlpA family protein disulfide reductase [Gemmatimonadota bacterium]
MKKRRQIVTVSVMALIAVLSALIWTNREMFTPLDVGSRAPDYVARSLDGDTVSLSSFAGEVIVLNIWATWCRPCVIEMPALQRLHEELSDAGLRVVAVSVDAPAGVVGSFGESGGDVAGFVESLGLTFTVLHDPTGRIESRYQVYGLPTTYIIDRQGRIQRKELGARDWDEPPLADQIRQLVEG